MSVGTYEELIIGLSIAVGCVVLLVIFRHVLPRLLK